MYLLLSYDNRVIVEGIKVQLEQGWDGASCACRRSGGFITGSLVQISFQISSNDSLAYLRLRNLGDLN